MKKIIVSISADKMLAYISGLIDEDITQEEIISLIKSGLSEKGVVFGLHEKLIYSVAMELLDNKKVDESIVAIGEYPKAEKLAGARFLVSFYLENNLKSEFVENIRKPVCYYKLLDCISKPYIVKENEKVGKLHKAERGVSGYNVLGESEDTHSQMQPSEDLRQGLITQYESLDIIAMISGIIVQKKNYSYILPVNLDGAVNVTVSDDNLKAYLHLFPAGPGGKNITRNDILKTLKNSSIVYGIKESAINEALDKMKETGKKVENVIIAEGVQPKSGKDAEIEYQVNLSFSHKPRILKDGRADYYSIHIFEKVGKNQIIAKILPPTDGKPGVDVFGNSIDATRGKENKLSIGKNIEFSPDDSAALVASKTGHVYLRNNNLLVEEILHIETDVDFRTGNVDFTGDIVIDGDVKSGFSVNAGGNISIGGTVEDAVVEAGESVIVRSGFIGKGKGRIKAGGDVVAKHVRNQTIMAKNNIMVDGEVLDASLFAGNEMFVEVKKSWIVGGVAVARNKIRAYSIGNASHVHTEVATGIDLFVKKILEELEKEIMELENELNIITLNEKRLFSKGLFKEMLTKGTDQVHSQLKILREKHEKKIKMLKKYKSHYRKSLYDTSGSIGVIGTVYPGVTVKIGNRKLVVSDAIKRILFYISDDQIESRSFSY